MKGRSIYTWSTKSEEMCKLTDFSRLPAAIFSTQLVSSPTLETPKSMFGWFQSDHSSKKVSNSIYLYSTSFFFFFPFNFVVFCYASSNLLLNQVLNVSSAATETRKRMLGSEFQAGKFHPRSRHWFHFRVSIGFVKTHQKNQQQA